MQEYNLFLFRNCKILSKKIIACPLYGYGNITDPQNIIKTLKKQTHINQTNPGPTVNNSTSHSPFLAFKGYDRSNTVTDIQVKLTGKAGNDVRIEERQIILDVISQEMTNLLQISGPEPYYLLILSISRTAYFYLLYTTMELKMQAKLQFLCHGCILSKESGICAKISLKHSMKF
ncbi:hypothetical protein ES288_A11G080700v1 [Gossypium darwinii]|uniref:Uncharacterized protein n=1 Tax=Gossypium darwinii TaxID=34276 RepID=A0A5D2EIR1_GOSDA|nr:hypothetical protein ES288_A11G080700v1 [Gossypium darwinii]